MDAIARMAKKSAIPGHKPRIFRMPPKPPIQAVTTAPTTQQIITFTTLPWRVVENPPRITSWVRISPERASSV
jgi:hypothetical protein